MNRTFIDINGNIQYLPDYNNLQDIYNLYYNKSIFIQPAQVVRPVIISSDYNLPIFTDYKLYSLPVISSYRSYFDVNNDPELRQKVYKYFYEEYKHMWLIYSFTKLVQFFNNVDDKITLVNSLDEYKNNKCEKDAKKYNFILKNIFGKHEMLVFIDKFVRRNNVNWYDLKKMYKDEIKSEIYYKIKNHLKKLVLKK